MTKKTDETEPEQIQTEPNQTEPELFRDSEFKMLEAEYNQMISSWMRTKRGTIVNDLATNIPERKLHDEKIPVLVLSFNSGQVAQ